MSDHSNSAIEVEGRCLCAGNHYRIAGTPTGMVHCHCQRCRKAHGASLVSWSHFEQATFTWLKRGDIGTFHSSDTIRRSFCTTCGSVIANPDSSRDQFGFPVGNVLNMPEPAPVYHFYTASRAPWTTISAAAEQFEVVHDRFADPGMPELDRPASPGKVRGSCLCGDVAFEASDPQFMMNCHCTRCRLSRAAPHATNLFAPRESLIWISGENQVQNYRLPEAERFGVGFCGRCSGLVPRTDSTSDLANIPAGCLDTDPGLAPRGHIWVGSKADWFTIVDNLPQFDASPRR
jgi:hypothetical protein